MNSFTNILFVASLEDDNMASFNRALDLANNNQAQLTVLSIVEGLDNTKSGSSRDKFRNAIIAMHRAKLEALVDGTRMSGKPVELKVLVGKSFIEIIREVLRHKHDLVITTVAQHDGIGQQHLGGTAAKLLRKCPCPVWLIKPIQQQGCNEILVGLDYDPGNSENDALNQKILRLATAVALADFSTLHIIHAWQLAYEGFLRSPRSGLTKAEVDEFVRDEIQQRQNWLTNLVDAVCGTFGAETENYLKPQLHLVRGDARSVVPEYANTLGVELIVMGTVGRTGIPGFLIGNTAEHILSLIGCSILAVKPEGFLSPVALGDNQ